MLPWRNIRHQRSKDPESIRWRSTVKRSRGARRPPPPSRDTSRERLVDKMINRHAFADRGAAAAVALIPPESGEGTRKIPAKRTGHGIITRRFCAVHHVFSISPRRDRGSSLTRHPSTTPCRCSKTDKLFIYRSKCSAERYVALAKVAGWLDDDLSVNRHTRAQEQSSCEMRLRLPIISQERGFTIAAYWR